MQGEGQQPPQVYNPQPSGDPNAAPQQTFVYSGTEEAQAPAQAAPPADQNQISWAASEYAAHQKSASWFMGLFVGGILVAALIYWLAKDIVAAVAIVLVSILFASFANRKPRVLDYVISSRGVQIGPKSYPYGAFKSFAMVDEGAPYILLLPIKRLMPPISLYYDPNQADQIADTLGQYLPLEHHQPDAIDSLLRRIRY